MHIRLTFLYLESMSYSPISNVCVPTNTKYQSAVPFMVPGIYDFLLLALTLTKGVQSAISLRTGSGSVIVCLKFQFGPTWKAKVNAPR
jgi:hypothetical protein